MKDKWEVLSALMMSEGKDVFLFERISAYSLRLRYEMGLAVILELQGVIIGYAAIWDTESPEWGELGSLWVHPAYRGHGLAVILYKKRSELIPSGMRSMTITHDARAAHLALEYGNLIEATKETWGEVPFALSCGPCDRVPEEQKDTCPFRAKETECRMFFKSR